MAETSKAECAEAATPIIRGSRFEVRGSGFVLGLILLFSAGAFATAAPAAPRDPRLQIVGAQPPIEIVTNVEVTAVFDPPVVRLGETSTYRVTFNALDNSIRLPDQIVAPPQLKLRPSARGEIFVLVGGKQQPKTAINYRVRAAAAGSHVIPEFEVQVYDRRVMVPAARLEVVAAPVTNLPPPARLDLELAATNAYLGQRITVWIRMSASPSNTIESLKNVRLNGDGFLVDHGAAHQTISVAARDGGGEVTCVYETVIAPLVTGNLTLSAQGFTAGNQFSGPITIQGQVVIPGGTPRFLLLDSDPVTIRIQPLPRSEELPGFTGAVGAFTRDPPQLSTHEARVGELVNLVVTFRGGPEVARLVAPPPPVQRNWQVFDALPGGAPAASAGAQPSPGSQATFTYTLIPLTDEVGATPPIPFSCFDPETGAYVDLTIPSLPIRILPGEAKTNAQPWLAMNVSGTTPEKKPALSDLVSVPGRSGDSLVPLQQRGWFVGVQLLPLAGLGGLWFWDRRRRFLERHPEIRLRRRARRALRRERRALQKAFQAGDAPRFAATAVKAMQVAGAPHFPAEPRALVGGDVVQLLNGAGRAAEVVRRFFATADASEFSGAAAQAGELLALQPELERVLEELEARL